jgi:serine/threonine protein kinase
LYATGGFLATVLSNSPAWWTPTVKAKAVVGIALGLRFAHGLGLLHEVVKASNILFDADRRIQIADFSSIRLETGIVEPFSGEG